MNNWDLSKLYKGFDDSNFLADQELLSKKIKEVCAKESDFNNYDNKLSKLVSYLKSDMELTFLIDKLMHFASLSYSVESTNMNAMKSLNAIQNELTNLARIETIVSKWLLNYPNIDKDINSDDFLKEHEFQIKENIENASHNLDEKTETLLARLRQNGSGAWKNLQKLLTSTMAVDYDGKEITLSVVRNLANDPNQTIRKAAYEAEIKAYEKIENSIAYSLNSIKGEVNIISRERGYDSPLAQSLSKSRMQQATLDAMQEACLEYMEVFRKYLKRKAKILGHSNGLPFYDLFAPIGKSNKTFTIPEANEYILKNFRTFSEDLYLMAKKAFKDHWVDYSPRKGKVGGAFCANIHAIKESRVMTNFTGAFGDMITLSHELGHAFHGESIFKESSLNSHYTMPVAETASTFCETIVNKAALKDATNDEERIFLLESSIQDYTQVVVDIMSRFLFEKSVFDGRLTTVFDSNELKELMMKAQLDTYGDGLDKDYLHPYMWVCKPHYYSGGLSYYNFPYTFGLLFAKGLYAKYLEDKESFVGMYDNLLRSTGKMMVEDAAMLAGIDVTKKAFWVSSLELLKQDIEQFLKLTE
ncbi:MAG: M3 family oligoendopeptidase [Tenericutes bacterium]|nr:M3 family oligoendopeptidase [Mycoplasmatota bacterium]